MRRFNHAVRNAALHAFSQAAALGQSVPPPREKIRPFFPKSLYLVNPPVPLDG
ncbi:hypothetical protein AtDm6_0124 [Acetobacter tropicalis]|uniref:Uncharacterized protein n=1 Tax=Acetobacter tropicalis TaxID=104102 RepID=A0A095BCF6_9PROT|nr:hypothetical protein AtDm6_0124 [Acetobacter tropicalis]